MISHGERRGRVPARTVFCFASNASDGMSAFVEPAIGSAETAEPYRFLDTLSYVRVPSEATDGRQSVVEMRLREGHAPPMHVHASADEAIHVTEGSIEVHTPAGTRSLGAGGSVVLPRGRKHGIVATEPATIVASTSPGGFDGFVTAVGDPADEAVVPSGPPSEAAVDRVSELAPDYDIEIVGPPPVDP